MVRIMIILRVKVVVIGGGTGSFVGTWIEKYTHDIAALVNMVDDGGSTA